MAKPRLQAFRNFPRELRTKIRSVTLVEVAGTWQVDNSIQISKVLKKELLQAAMEFFHKYDNDIL